MKQLDIFGSLVSLRFQGKQIHKTNVGAFTTLIILTIILGRLVQLINDRLLYKNPLVIFSEIINPDHPPFLIKPNEFQLAIGLLGQDLKYIKDGTIFNVKGLQKIKNQDDNSIDGEFVQTEFNLENCTPENEVPKGTINQFINTQIYQHYCIPRNIQLQIEGNVNSKTYSEIAFILSRCTGDKCADPLLINSILDNHQVEILFTDVVVSSENKDNPFQYFLQDKKWQNSQINPKMINLYLRNNVVNTDVGWFEESIETKMIPSFSYLDIQVIQNAQIINIQILIYYLQQKQEKSQPNVFFQINLQYEKVKENQYKRSYQTGFQIIAELGGYSQIIIILFLFVCSGYSQLNLNKAIIDEIFNFQEQNFKYDLNDQYQKNRLSISCQPQKVQSTQDNQKRSSLFKGYNQDARKREDQSENHIFDVVNELQSNQIYTERKESINVSNTQSVKIENEAPPITTYCFQKISLIKKMKELVKKGKCFYERQRTSSYQVNLNSKDKQTLKQSEAEFKRLLDKTTNSINFNIIQYFISFFCKCRKLNHKKKIFEFSINRLYQHLDIQYILKKLIELDKLKRIILDDNQIQLLEYLPKPSVNYFITKDNQLFIDDDKNDVFYHETRSELEKMNNALQSFQNIMTKQHQTEIDQKILSFIDQRYNSLFQSTLKKKTEQPKLAPDYSIFNIQYDEYNTSEQNNKTIENTISTYKPIIPVKNPQF